MASLIKRLLGIKDQLPFDIEKAVGQMLLKMPRCSAALVVAGPGYSDVNYNGDVIVDAAGLLPWAEHHADALWSSNNYEQAARKALPVWLRGADLSNMQPTLLSQPFIDVLRPYVLDFFNKGIAAVHCRECQRSYREVRMNKFNEKKTGSWSYWTDEWRCEHGHLLYHEDHELHFF